MKVPSFKGLTIKVTLISCLVFAIFLLIIFIAQFSLIYNNQKWLFEEHSKKFFSGFIASNAVSLLDDFTSSRDEKISLFSHFGNHDYTFSESIIFKNNDNSLVFPDIVEYVNFEYPLQTSEKEKILSLSAEETHFIRIAWTNFFLYRQNIGEYSIFYYEYAISFYDYYYALFLEIGILIILIVLSFFGVSLYFSQLVVRPIREQNIALAMYNHNLAHEIKTPLAVMQSNFDMFEITKNENFIDSSREELEHIKHITDSLLFLTDAKNHKKNFIETDILELLNDVLLRFPFLHFEKNFSKTPILARIDVQLFSILIKNIIENASKYASDKNVSIVVEKNFILFKNAISETLTPKELQKIEEIFYQSDNSRGSEGYGLGIPMMRKICEIFDWKMKISSYHNTFEVKIFL